MPSAEDDAIVAAQRPDGSVDHEVYFAEYRRGLAERRKRLMTDARAVFRAMDGWPLVRTGDQWQETVRQAAEDLDCGGFLIDRLGAERYLDPDLMATLLVLRRRLIDEHQATTAAELMLIDSAVLSYFHTIRINGWIGDLSAQIEAEFFRKESLSAKQKGYYGTDSVRGLRVEDLVGQLVERLMPLPDRSNRMMIRNLKALRAMREPTATSVTIGSAGQVNVAAQQANAVRAGDRANIAPEPGAALCYDEDRGA